MLEAAIAVVTEQGAARLTLDAVARAAKVSKGGLMYHFPTKESLLQALVTRAIEHTQQSWEQAQQRLPDRPGRGLRAYVQASTAERPDLDPFSSALLAVVPGDPQLLEPVRAYFRERMPALSEGVPFERAALVYLATEGLWLLELVGASPYTRSQRSKVQSLLKRLAAEGGSLP